MFNLDNSPEKGFQSITTVRPSLSLSYTPLNFPSTFYPSNPPPPPPTLSNCGHVVQVPSPMGISAAHWSHALALQNKNNWLRMRNIMHRFGYE